jgi:hypothetical protein
MLLCGAEEGRREEVRVIAIAKGLKETNFIRRMINNLWRKLKAYETILRRLIPQISDDDREAVEKSLLMVITPLAAFSQLMGAQAPQLDNKKSSNHRPQKATGDTDGDADGESDITGIGSMGSTGHAHEEDFKGLKFGRKSQAFVGQSSEEKWIRHLEKELPDFLLNECCFLHSPDSSFVKDEPLSPKFSCYVEDMNTFIGNEIDSYDMSLKSIADLLVNAFFATIYPSFPIINQVYFFNRYEECFATAEISKYDDQTFLIMLQLIFAIEAVHPT